VVSQKDTGAKIAYHKFIYHRAPASTDILPSPKSIRLFGFVECFFGISYIYRRLFQNVKPITDRRSAMKVSDAVNTFIKYHSANLKKYAEEL